MLAIHHAGKMGDLIYALPVMKALSRERGEKVHLITSALCFQLVPLLWEQSYIQNVEMDYSRSYCMRNGSVEPWAVLSPGEGINLSPQPSMYRPDAPVSWTMAYAEIAGIKELTLKDKIALPSLWNHRQWYWEHVIKVEGKPEWRPPETVVLAPESESIRTVPLWVWHDLAKQLRESFMVIVVGMQTEEPYFDLPGIRDLRGLTTLASAAKMMAEACAVVSTISLPFQIARHAGTPTFCLQDQYLERCIPVDTPYRWYVSNRLDDLVDEIFFLKREQRTTLWSDKDILKLQEAVA